MTKFEVGQEVHCYSRYSGKRIGVEETYTIKYISEHNVIVEWVGARGVIGELSLSRKQFDEEYRPVPKEFILGESYIGPNTGYTYQCHYADEHVGFLVQTSGHRSSITGRPGYIIKGHTSIVGWKKA